MLSAGREFVGSGPLHRRRLSNIDIRISVSGIRGKSTAVRWLQEVLYGREYDTYAKVTGIEPLSIYNGTEHEIDRPAKVRLYENERQLRGFGPVDVAILENQGIRSYTTRLVNEEFVRPHVIFLTNVREDHLDTLGGNRANIARSLARSVPADTHVICGEQDRTIRDYLEAELDRRDATITHVDIPSKHEDLPGAEIVYGINPVLRAVDEPPLDDARLDSYLDRMRVAWTRLPEGRVYNAAAVNDPQSTELVRRQLVTDSEDVIQPLLYLREDRRGRTAVFLRYLESLAEHGVIEQARVIGRDAQLFGRHASFPVVTHDEESETPARVLDAALTDGWPVILMGNAVPEFIQEVAATIDDREVETALA
ncbi:MAG: Mur ligase [Halovenus sp.]